MAGPGPVPATGMLVGVDPLLIRIEALPRRGQFAVAFRLADGTEHAMVVEVEGSDVVVPEASRVPGWAEDSATYRGWIDAVLAVERARTAGPSRRMLVDVPGGWDVSLGNVTVGSDGEPVCAADGPMTLGADGVYTCEVCGARATFTD
jgi:hypothetical protein